MQLHSETHVDETWNAHSPDESYLDDRRPQTALRPNVMVVDDDPTFLQLAVAAFSAEGLGVTVARTAGEAMLQAVRNPPDLILLDILLSGADGIDVLDALRAEPETHRVPVLACTAIGQRSSAGLLTSLGFDGLLTKPIDLIQLARTLRAMLPSRKRE